MIDRNPYAESIKILKSWVVERISKTQHRKWSVDPEETAEEVIVFLPEGYWGQLGSLGEKSQEHGMGTPLQGAPSLLLSLQSFSALTACASTLSERSWILPCRLMYLAKFYMQRNTPQYFTPSTGTTTLYKSPGSNSTYRQYTVLMFKDASRTRTLVPGSGKEFSNRWLLLSFIHLSGNSRRNEH